MNFNPELLAFGYPINWEKGVLQKKEWLTRVIASQQGLEQRQALRITPRRSYETTVYVTGMQRFHLEAYLSRRAEMTEYNQRGMVYAPLWHEAVIAEQGISAGVGITVKDLYYYEFAQTNAVIVHDPVTKRFALYERSWAGSDQLEVLNLEPWPAGTFVMPAKICRVEEKPKFSKLNDHLYEGIVRLRQWEYEPLGGGGSIGMGAGMMTLAGH